MTLASPLPKALPTSGSLASAEYLFLRFGTLLSASINTERHTTKVARNNKLNFQGSIMLNCATKRPRIELNQAKSRQESHTLEMQTNAETKGAGRNFTPARWRLRASFISCFAKTSLET